MPIKGFVWDEDYRKKYYSNPKVKQHMEVFTEMAKLPKSDDVKHKMSIAKKNVPKTEEHKAKMAETQKRRHELFGIIKEQHPELSKAEVWDRVKEHLKGDLVLVTNMFRIISEMNQLTIKQKEYACN